MKWATVLSILSFLTLFSEGLANIEREAESHESSSHFESVVTDGSNDIVTEGLLGGFEFLNNESLSNFSQPSNFNSDAFSDWDVESNSTSGDQIVKNKLLEESQESHGDHNDSPNYFHGGDLEFDETHGEKGNNEEVSLFHHNEEEEEEFVECGDEPMIYFHHNDSVLAHKKCKHRKHIPLTRFPLVTLGYEKVLFPSLIAFWVFLANLGKLGEYIALECIRGHFITWYNLNHKSIPTYDNIVFDKQF